MKCRKFFIECKSALTKKLGFYFIETKGGEMLRYVTKELAQKIVCRTMEIIDCNINVMNEKRSHYWFG
jgi:carbohydrate diacid regulator